MKQSIFQYVLGRLSVLNDEDLKKVDLESARSLIKESDISEEDKKSLEKLFSSIQDYSGIYHHGIKGMRWGIRRYQNKDGSLTPAGKKRSKKEHEEDGVSRNEKRVKNIQKVRRVALASKAVSTALNAIGNSYYNRYKNGATVGQVNVVKGAGYASKALNIVGNLAIGSEMVQRYRYGRDYWK